MQNALWVILIPFGITLLIYLEAILRLESLPQEVVISRGYDDRVYQTFMLTLVIVAWMMKALSRDLSSALQRLLSQRVISEKKEEGARNIVLVFWRWRKHWSRHILSAIFVAPGLWFSYAIIYNKNLNRLLPGNESSSIGPYATEVWLSNLVTSIGILLALFLVGNWIFEIIITARIINHAPKYFDLEIMPSHPDKCGGLKIVGDLCLKMVYVVLIPTLFIGFWLVVSINPPEMQTLVPDYVLSGDFRTPVKAALVLLVASGIVVFFWPLYTVHRRMLDERADLGQVLDNIAHRIQELNRELMSDPDTIAIEDNRKRTLSDIESLKELFQHFRKVPTWPFDRSVLIKFITTQTVPIISIIGLGSGQFDELLDIMLGLL